MITYMNDEETNIKRRTGLFAQTRVASAVRPAGFQKAEREIKNGRQPPLRLSSRKIIKSRAVAPGAWERTGSPPHLYRNNKSSPMTSSPLVMMDSHVGADVLWDDNEATKHEAAAAMEWTRDKTLELLRQYRERSVLWDWNSRGYRDRTKRKRAIQELATNLGCNTLEVEKKITNLKCQYSREVHKIQNSKETARGPEDLYVSKWFAFKSMQFLQFGTRRYSKRKKLAEGSKLEEEYIVSDIDPIAYFDSIGQDETNGSMGNASLSEDAEESSSSSLRAIENLPMCETEVEAISTYETNAEIDENCRTKIREEYVKFGECIALQLSKISDSYSRSVAKLRINQILFEAEIGLYAQTRR